jgi:phosphohistidine phosphatase
MSIMKRLILLRHAKSAWEDPDLDDHDRPLNRRGRLSAPLMGAWMADRGFLPDRVLCSTSTRTVETWALARAALPGAPDAVAEPRLYHADPATMLELVRATPDAAATLLLIGHQPGLGSLTRKLAAPGAPIHCTRAFQKFPTAACAVIDFPVESWPDVAFGAGAFHAFGVPRELV